MAFYYQTINLQVSLFSTVQIKSPSNKSFVSRDSAQANIIRDIMQKKNYEKKSRKRLKKKNFLRRSIHF